jgi:succinate dehydrogenase/fumarate reductase flavoprotein subunit
METMNLLDLGELVFRAALERKETRGLHVQPDYPLTDPMLDGKNLFITRRDGQPVLEWRTLD